MERESVSPFARSRCTLRRGWRHRARSGVDDALVDPSFRCACGGEVPPRGIRTDVVSNSGRFRGRLLADPARPRERLVRRARASDATPACQRHECRTAGCGRCAGLWVRNCPGPRRPLGWPGPAFESQLPQTGGSVSRYMVVIVPRQVPRPEPAEPVGAQRARRCRRRLRHRSCRGLLCPPQTIPPQTIPCPARWRQFGTHLVRPVPAPALPWSSPGSCFWVAFSPWRAFSRGPAEARLSLRLCRPILSIPLGSRSTRPKVQRSRPLSLRRA